MVGAGRSRVALASEASRYESVCAALAGISDEVELGSAERVLIKPNFVSTRRQLAATHVDAVRAVLEFVRARHAGQITIGEGPAASPAHAGFSAFGYGDLTDKYGVELVDLNADQTVPVVAYDSRLRPMTLYLARSVVEADYRISVGPPKTHDTVVVTLSIKNMAMGALVNPVAPSGNGRAMHFGAGRIALVPVWLQRSRLAELVKSTMGRRPRGSSKRAMHQSLPVINLNLAMVASRVWPHLSVIDGWTGMEGAGPSMGDPVDWRVALAGTDALAVDVLAAHLMGHNPAQIGYLVYCGEMELGNADLDQIDIVGDVMPADVQRSFRPHPSISRQLVWQLEDAGKHLQRCRV